MNAQPFFSVSRLATGVSRISLRRGHTKTPFDPTKAAKVVEPTDPRLGEQIWIFNHIMNNHVVYSHRPVLSNAKAMRQIPFNGKKLKPPSLRKDMWKPMAMIQFPEGLAEVGRSVFHKMREFRKRHELEWENEEYFKLSKHDRGVALNDQKGNTVADIAAVLGGAGKGNKIWQEEPTARKGDGGEKQNGKLHSATVYWADAQDQAFASEWPSNVEHQLGLPSQSRAETAEIPQDGAVDEHPPPGTETAAA